MHPEPTGESLPSAHGRPVAFTQRVSYAASDTAGQLIFTVISFYLLKFYTDIAGLSALVAGNVLLLARLVDSLDAPLWGIVFERVQSRWGKSRPWFLWLCVPFALSGVLTFATPPLPGTLKAIYAAITYIVCSVLYTGINTPVTAILSALTNDPRQRVVLTTFRMFGSKAGVLIVNATLLPCIAWFGQGDDKLGIIRTLPIYAAGSIVLYLVAFRNLRERLPAAAGRTSLRKSFSTIAGNWPWIIIVASSLLFWIAFIARISTVPYFFEYVWHRGDLVPLANGLDVVSLAALLFLPWLCFRTSKRNVWAWGLVGAAGSQFLLYAGIAAGSNAVLFTGWIFGILTSGLAMAMPFSLLADSVDYGEWKTGVRAAGLLTAIGAAFCLKVGSGLGGALPAWILSATEYQANRPQNAHALAGILFAFVWLPAIFYALALVPVLFYGRYEILESRIAEALRNRRAPPGDSALP
jgi:sugar (glycoside-pentoside-hexuronide) transporter